MSKDSQFTILKAPYAQPPRALPIALAHQMIKTKVGSPYMVTLYRVFAWMPFSFQVACRAELTRCRQARRGQHLAEVCQVAAIT